jgi:C4-dicarboxylate-specific signal transduction histidine kinase
VSSLPPDTVLLFKRYGAFEEHSAIISMVALVVGLQSLLVSALLFQRRRRREAEKSLRDSEARMTFTASTANVGLWQFNRKSGEVWSTEHCRNMLGFPPDSQPTRESFLAAVHPDDRESVIAAIRNAEVPQLFDARIVLPGGEVRWFRIHSVPTTKADGVLGQLAGIIVDITEQKAAEADATLQRQQVAHLMRVSMLGELSGAIAHEVNQPLTAIMSNAQAALHLLKQRSPDLLEVTEALKDIVSEDNRAGEVIQRLRMLMKKGESHFQSIDIHELVRSTADLLHSELVGRGVRLHTIFAAPMPAVSGDLVQLQQVLINLIVNASDAMASTLPSRRVVSISTGMLPSGAVEIRIKDNGPGLRPSDRGRLFEAFYTTKPNGLGLGLSICATIVQAHRGELTLANEETGGVVAILTLPAQQASLTDEALFAAK